MDPFLLATKLRIPPQPYHGVRRVRLIDALEREILHYKLVLISAPAGYGKTMLLSQWAHASRFPVVWLSISEEDNDLERFLRYLLTGWEEVQPEIRESPLGLLLEAMSPDTEAVLSAFINVATNASDPVVFILDDYHLIEEPSIHAALTFLLDHLPPTLHFVLAGRGEPPLPLARFRARHELMELRAEELSFLLEETTNFLNEMMGLDPGIIKLHSSEYRNPSQLQDGGVLIVGAGNSGSEIALEVSHGHPAWISGRDTGHMPFRIEGVAARLGLIHLVLRFLFHRVLTVNTPIGRKVRPKVLSRGGPLIRVQPKDLAAAGIEHVPRTVGVRDGLPMLEDDRIVDVANVVWCTGFQPGFSWIDLPVLGETEPMHERGVVANEPGLYFVGLHFLSALSSAMIHGVARDAEHVVRAITSRTH